jgi:tellurite resistance-related uncharacterized protein
MISEYLHRAVCLNYWHTAQTPIYTPQDMPQEVSSQSKSRTDYGRCTVLHRSMDTWNSRFEKQIKKTPYGTVGTVKPHEHWHRHLLTHTLIHTYDNKRTIHTHGYSNVDMW